MKKRLVQIADRIVELEKEIQQIPNSIRAMVLMEKLTEGLTLTEMLEIDNYIQKKKLLDAVYSVVKTMFCTKFATFFSPLKYPLKNSRS